MVSKVTEAVSITRELAPDLNVDGKLQFDSVVVPDVAQRKVGKSTVAGRANVFIFPNLDAANIGYKIMQRAAGADAIEPILQGFDKPWLDLSRGASAKVIIAVATIAASQSMPAAQYKQKTMNSKHDIVSNWLPRYAGTALNEFGRYILLTKFSSYVSNRAR